MSALLSLERLSPLERAVFLMREVFAYDFPEVAAAVGRSEADCRQLLLGAERHMAIGRPRFEADRKAHEELAARFFDVLLSGDVEGLREMLAADVQLVGEVGDEAPALGRVAVGADKVARLLASVFPELARVHVTLDQREVNGQPGAVLRDREDNVVYALALDVLGGQIQTIRSLGNPDIAHEGPVADA